jgi:hypothetical protein
VARPCRGDRFRRRDRGHRPHELECATCTCAACVGAALTAVVAAALAKATSSDALLGAAFIIDSLLLLIAATTILRRVVGAAEVDFRTILGAISVFTLLGLLFGYLYLALGRLGGGQVFAGVPHAQTRDYLFFSYTTLTTTGYGNLVPTGDVGQIFAVFEMLIGQFSLVTLVAGLVSLWRPAPRREERPKGAMSSRSEAPPLADADAGSDGDGSAEPSGRWARARQSLRVPGSLVRLAKRDPHHVPERLTIYTIDRQADEARSWAQRAREGTPERPRAMVVDDQLRRTITTARVDGAVAGTPFLIALVPAYIAFLRQEVRLHCVWPRSMDTTRRTRASPPTSSSCAAYTRTRSRRWSNWTSSAPPRFPRQADALP